MRDWLFIGANLNMKSYKLYPLTLLSGFDIAIFAVLFQLIWMEHPLGKHCFYNSFM